MKPKDLKSPFSWKERSPHYADSVLYVPIYYEEHDGSVYPGFEREAPIHVEFCSGNGDWIIAKALAHPEINWIANEMQFNRVRKIWSKMKNHDVTNLHIVCGMAEDFTDHYLRENMIDAAYVNFPDPWWKDRQAKHRLIKDPFISTLSNRMKGEGSMTLVTDFPAYASQMHNEFNLSPLWQHRSCELNPTSYGYSYFESLWKSKGLDMCKLTFENVL
jgi:tRNA (guanine-N7-)-methyltransferase